MCARCLLGRVLQPGTGSGRLLVVTETVGTSSGEEEKVCKQIAANCCRSVTVLVVHTDIFDYCCHFAIYCILIYIMC